MVSKSFKNNRNGNWKIYDKTKLLSAFLSVGSINTIYSKHVCYNSRYKFYN